MPIDEHERERERERYKHTKPISFSLLGAEGVAF
jgi:hypothetical protein